MLNCGAVNPVRSAPMGHVRQQLHHGRSAPVIAATPRAVGAGVSEVVLDPKIGTFAGFSRDSDEGADLK